MADPAEFQDIMSAEACVSFVFAAGGRFRARFTQLKLNHLRLTAVEESISRIGFIKVPSDMMLVGLSIEHITPPVWGGVPVERTELVSVDASQGVHMRTAGRFRWGAIWLPIREFTRYSGALTGMAMTIPSVTCCWRPPPRAERQLRQLYSAAMRTTHARSGPVTGPEAAHGLEQQLIYNLVECLSATTASLADPMAQRAQDVMTRFEELIQSHPEGDLSAPRICATLDVPDRFLRKCCEGHLGMGPMSYVRLCRMQLVHRTLQNRAPNDVRVADVAERYGFCNAGRFAGAYRELYGELPSETLRRGLRSGAPAIRYRSRAAGTQRRQLVGSD